MAWARTLAKTVLIGSAMIALPVAAETIVVRASGPSAKDYPPGRKLADAGSVALKAGDVVTLLDAKGTRTLRGPGRYAVSGASMVAVNATTLEAMLDSKRIRRARTGAVRGAVGEAPAGPPRRPNLWLVDVAQPGTVCVADPANVRLWRADTSKPITMKLVGGSGATGTVGFGAGESIAAWPTALPVGEGMDYRLTGTGAVPAVEIRFSVLENGQGDGLEQAATGLIAHHCTAQLDLLAATSALPDPAPEG